MIVMIFNEHKITLGTAIANILIRLGALSNSRN